MDLRPLTLEGTRIRLEPLKPEHLDPLCEAGLDAALWEWTLSQVRNRDEMCAYVETALRSQAEGLALPFVIVDRASERVIGSTRYGNVDSANRRVEIGWTWIAPAWHRTPVNTEAKYLLLRHAFEVLECLRVELKTDALNERSRRAISRIGAKEEGILRKHGVTAGGRVRDTVYFSILDDEWPAVRAGLEQRLARPFPAR